MLSSPAPGGRAPSSETQTICGFLPADQGQLEQADVVRLVEPLADQEDRDPRAQHGVGDALLPRFARPM
jgi:hypothetical protein